ncbi:MAG: sigma factor [Sciscionella sp.]
MAELRTRHEAFAEYVLPEVEVLYRVARSLTGQAADAEGLVQDTLLRAFQAIDGFDGRHPRAWLLTILRNTEHNRHRRRRPSLLNDPDEPPERTDQTVSVRARNSWSSIRYSTPQWSRRSGRYRRNTATRWRWWTYRVSATPKRLRSSTSRWGQ